VWAQSSATQVSPVLTAEVGQYAGAHDWAGRETSWASRGKDVLGRELGFGPKRFGRLPFIIIFYSVLNFLLNFKF
jgi:hypothetical protein